MNDPVRLRDEAESSVELMLLQVGTSYRSSPNARAKTLAALGLAGSAAVTAGAVGAASGSLFSKLGWGKLAVISSVGATVVAPVGYVAWHHTHEAPPMVAQAAVPARPLVAPPAVVPEPAPAVEAEKEAPAPPPAVAKSEVRPGSAGALAAELSALDAARSSLSSGDPNGALAKLDDYSRSFPRGHLVLEAEVVRIDALSRAGQTAQAKRRAEAFLRRHPNSVLASRVRAYTE
jgi:hypothetical protein